MSYATENIDHLIAISAISAILQISDIYPLRVIASLRKTLNIFLS